MIRASSQDDFENAKQDTAKRPARRKRWFVLGLLLGVVIAVIAALATFGLGSRDATPRLTRADYQAAVERWAAHGPASYDADLELLLPGARPGKIHIEVRDREVRRMTRDGVEPKQRRTWDYWSVPGQLDTIGQELDKAENPAVGFQAPPGSRVIQKAFFDPKYGYPINYHRIILGTNLEISWQVTHFEAIDSSAASDTKIEKIKQSEQVDKD